MCIVADLLLKSFSEYGVVTRYAGDEFVIMINTTDDQLIQKRNAQFLAYRELCIFVNKYF